MYHELFDALGPQGWWPARTTFEVMAGAILTQATRWDNVEEAIRRLRKIGGLTPRGLLRLPRPDLLECLKPAGYYRQKAERLLGFTRWYVSRYRGSRRMLSRRPTRALRGELLALPGIGQETADSILLYALDRPVFVVDAYTRRILSRHRLMREPMRYEALQQRIIRDLAPNRRQCNEFHALLVEIGKRYCSRRNPKCTICPLQAWPRTVETIERSV